MTVNLEVAGFHPTTVACMAALQALSGAFTFAKVLDLGCGSGVLSVMAAHWWQAEIIAADISPQAVEDTQALVAQRGLRPRIRVVRSDGFSAAQIAQAAPYDLIIFNLLAEPVARMAPEVAAHLAEGGVCVVSGILGWLEHGVREAYEAQGFTLISSHPHEPWRTLVWQKR